MRHEDGEAAIGGGEAGDALRRAARVVGIDLGGLAAVIDIAQFAMFALGEWAFYRYLADDGSWAAETVINFSYQAVAFVVPSILVVLILTRLLHTKSMLYPSVVYAANLAFGLWWIPLALVLGTGPETKNILPVLPISILSTALVYFSVAYWVVRRKAL